MTCIVSPEVFTSKKALEALANAGGHAFRIKDPSMFAPRDFNVLDMQPGQSEIVTNHPKRDKFAKITRKADGSFKVS